MPTGAFRSARHNYLIYSNKYRGACLIFSCHKCGGYLRMALIWGRRLFKNCTRRIYFLYIFIQWYTFYLLIFLWTDTKLMVNLELREKFTRWRKTREFHDNESENISGESELLCRCGTIYNVQSILMSLSGVRRLFEGGAYSSNYGIVSSFGQLRTSL